MTTKYIEAFNFDAFNRVGSVNVTNDGIASGFSSANYVNNSISINTSSTKTVTIQGQWTYGKSSGDVAMMYELYNSDGHKLRQEVSADGGSTKALYLQTTAIGTISFDTALVVGDVLSVTAVLDFANKKFSETLIVNGKKTYTLNASMSDTTTYNTLYIGIYTAKKESFVYPWDGSINLKEFKLIADGKTVIDGTRLATLNTYGKGNSMKAVVKYDRKYYKYTDWTQPTLTANGTIGNGSTFACDQSALYSSEYAYKCFDKNTGTQFTLNGNTGYITFYNPIPLKIQQLNFTNGYESSYVRPISSGNLQGSDDYNNWTTLKTFTNSVKTVSGTWSVDVNATKSYRYFKLNMVGDGSYARIAELGIIAKEITEGTSSDYDYFEYIPVGYLPKINGKYYAIAQ